MINRLSYLVSALLLLISCTSPKVNEKREVKQSYKPNLLQFPFLYIPEENNLSFPLWFNDSILSAYHIVKLDRRTYVFDMEDSIDITKPSISDLNERKEYRFNPTGSIKNVRFTYFFDGEKIGHMAFHYTLETSIKGYCFAENTDTTNAGDFSIGIKNDLPIKQHEILRKNSRFLSFKTIHENNKLFFLPNSAFWGALAVDSILHPKPDDKIILGSPTKPVKSYKVRNKVLQKDVMRFMYVSGTTILKKMTWIDFPFSTTRTFRFDKLGRCAGFTDSLFSGHQFLKRSVVSIWFNKKNLPVKILFKHELNPGKQQLGRMEVFRYTFRD
jgi:hypothetical protein